MKLKTATTTTLTVNEYFNKLKRASITGDASREVTGISRDTRTVASGDLFVCIDGGSFDSHSAALEVLEKGAAAVVVNAGGLAKVGIQVPDDATVITVKNTRAALPIIACEHFGNPSYSMKVFGITGTNGKSTSTLMVAAILRASGMNVGTIGTLGAELDGIEIESAHTTPEADQLQAILATMRDNGADAVVMEVSSHALAQYRTDGIAFSGAIFTNLTQDHLDFHETMEAYFEAKTRLFAEYPIAYPRPDKSAFIAVITISQWEGRELVILARGDIVTFATDDSPAVLRAENITLSASSVGFDAIYDAGIEKYQFRVDLPIGGAFQVGNALGAIGLCLRAGIARETVAAGLASLPGVPGRFESVSTAGLGFSVVVDYAHTPDGLANLLKSAAELKPIRIVLVFGCGGNRDRKKRPIMGRLAATMADVAIVTSDNPRHESPEAIIAEITIGMSAESSAEKRAQICVEPDRRRAIAHAIRIAEPGDLVLIAGKGHETYQLVGDQVLDFDDRVIARECIQDRISFQSNRT